MNAPDRSINLVTPFEGAQIKIRHIETESGPNRIRHRLRRSASHPGIRLAVDTHDSGLAGGVVLDDFYHCLFPQTVQCIPVFGPQVNKRRPRPYRLS